MEYLVSFFSGILSAFTPCVIVLFPLLLFKFFTEKHLRLKNFAVFIAGFLTFYLAAGLLLSNILNSSMQNGFKAGLGTLFIVLGFLNIFRKTHTMNTPVFRNPFLLGGSFALIVTTNPCTIPYIGFIISLTSSTDVFLNLLFYGIGLITPALVFAAVGSAFIGSLRKKTKILKKTAPYMNWVLILSGLYIFYTIKSFGEYDIYVSAMMLAAIFFVILRAYFITYSRKDLIKPKNILLIASMILLLYVALTHCRSFLEKNDAVEVEDPYVNTEPVFGRVQSTDTHQVCDLNAMADDEGCEVCQRCIGVFLVAALLGLAGAQLSRR